MDRVDAACDKTSERPVRSFAARISQTWNSHCVQALHNNPLVLLILDIARAASARDRLALTTFALQDLTARTREWTLCVRIAVSFFRVYNTACHQDARLFENALNSQRMTTLSALDRKLFFSRLISCHNRNA